MSPRRLGCCSASLALIVLCAAPFGGLARADTTSVAFLGVTSSDGDEALADAVAEALEREASAVAEWRLERSPASIEQLTMAHDCEPSETECRASMGAGLSAELGLYGVIRERTPGTQLVRIELFRASTGESVGEANREVLASDLSGSTLTALVAELLGFVRGLEPEPQDAPVVAKVPEPEPGAKQPQPVEEVEPVTEPDPSDDSSSGVSEVIGYGLIGASVVSIGLTVFAWTQIDSAMTQKDFVAYQKAIGDEGLEVDDVCAEAEDNEAHGLTQVQLAEVLEQCDRGSTYEVLQYVFIGAAVVTGGVGTYLVLTSGGDDGEAAARLTPRIGKGHASLALSMRF